MMKIMRLTMINKIKETILNLLEDNNSPVGDISDRYISNLSTIIELLLNNEEYEIQDTDHDVYLSGVSIKAGHFTCSKCHLSKLKTDLVFHATTDDYEVFIYKCLHCGNYIFKKEVSELKGYFSEKTH